MEVSNHGFGYLSMSSWHDKALMQCPSPVDYASLSFHRNDDDNIRRLHGGVSNRICNAPPNLSFHTNEER